MRPILSREACSIGAPKNFVFDVCAPTQAESPTNPTFGVRIRSAVRTGVVNRIVHILLKKILLILISQQAGAGGIAERTPAAGIDAIDRFDGKIKYERPLFVALRKRRLNLLAFRNVFSNRRESHRSPVCSGYHEARQLDGYPRAIAP